MGQVHTSRLVLGAQSAMSPSSFIKCIPATDGDDEHDDDDDFESNIAKAKTNIRSFHDDLPTMRKELGPRAAVEMIDEATTTAESARDLLQIRLQTNFNGKDPLAQTGTYRLRFHLKCIEESLDRIGQIREECLLEASTAGHRGDESQSPGGHVRHDLAESMASCPTRGEAASANGSINPFSMAMSPASTTLAEGRKKSRGKTPARSTRTSPRRKEIAKKGDERQGEVIASAETSTQHADGNLSGSRKSPRKPVPTSPYESPEVPKAYQKKNRNNKSSRITMRLRQVKAGEIDGFVMDDDVLYPVKIKERDGRMMTVAWCGGYSGTIKVRKGQVKAPTPQNIAEWNHIAADANEIRERIIKDREKKETRKRKKRQEEVEAKRAKRLQKERSEQLERQHEAKKCRDKYGPPLDSKIASVPTAKEGDIKMQGSRLIYYAYEDDTPERIATRFGVPVARVVYDNEGHVQGLVDKSMLKAYTPIILPSEI